MLVISRRENDRIVFPSLGISIVFNHLTRSRVRVGVNAPRDVPVVRHELLEEGQVEFDSIQDLEQDQIQDRLRDEVESLTMKFQSVQQELDAGRIEIALSMLAGGLEELEQLRQSISSCDEPDECDLSSAEGVSETSADYLKVGCSPAGEDRESRRFLIHGLNLPERIDQSNSSAGLSIHADDSGSGHHIVCVVSPTKTPHAKTPCSVDAL